MLEAARRLEFLILARSQYLLAGILLWTSVHAQEQPWRYILGEPRLAQQGSFCLSEEDTLEIARIFEKFSARTGYAALANAPNCATRVESFTPQRVVARITVAEGKPTEYQVTFVEVVTARGDTSYLVTTREVQE